MSNTNLYPLTVDSIQLNVFINPNESLLKGGQKILDALFNTTADLAKPASYDNYNPILVGTGQRRGLTFKAKSTQNFTMVMISNHELAY